MRADTHDVVLTPFKGIRKDGAFRRRLDFRIARAILSQALAGHCHRNELVRSMAAG
jgi:hypothetical protein